jgi:hypothetical protein
MGTQEVATGSAEAVKTDGILVGPVGDSPGRRLQLNIAAGRSTLENQIRRLGVPCHEPYSNPRGDAVVVVRWPNDELGRPSC